MQPTPFDNIPFQALSPDFFLEHPSLDPLPQQFNPLQRAVMAAQPHVVNPNLPQLHGFWDQSMTGFGRTYSVVNPPTKPSLTVNEELIRGLLTRDFISRKIRQWRLLTDDEMQDTLTATLPWLQGTYENFDYSGDVHIVGRRHAVASFDVASITWPQLENDTIQRLEMNYPCITALLEEYQDRLIAAGGAVNYLLHNNESQGVRDIDLFFVDSQVEQCSVSDDTKQDKATAFLVEVVTFLVDMWLNRPPAACVEDHHNRMAYIFRGEFVTTVFLNSSNNSVKYQFIHRVYPSIAAVLGGFDLGPAMIAFTGRQIVATELGAWSSLAKTILVDTSRRSTSFEHRLMKYADFCHIILPGLPRDISIDQIMPNLKPVGVVDRMLYQTISDHGYCFGKVQPNGEEGNYQGHYDLVKNDSAAKYEKLVTKLRQKAAKYGYEFSGDLHLTQIYNPPIALGPIDGTKNITAHDLKVLLMTIAHEHGYRLDIETLIQSHRETSRGAVRYDRVQNKNGDVSYLMQLDPSLKLPKLDINCKPNDRRNRYDKVWNVRPNRDVQYAATTDYEDEFVMWPSGKGDVKTTDYADSTLWPEYMIMANFTTVKKSQHDVAPVVSICCFKNTDTPLPMVENQHGGDSFRTAGLLAMRDLTVDVDKLVKTHNRNGMNRTPVTSRDILRQLFLASIKDPQLGDFTTVDIEHDKRLHDSSQYAEAVKTRTIASRSNLIGIKWILRNPGTQWTSSINPIVKHPRDWYGEYYRSFRLGNQEVETCLRLLRLRRGNPFSAGTMPRDVFKLLLIAIFML